MIQRSWATILSSSDLPFETSPVFFRPEVLLKYKADSEKYRIEHRSITCRSSWELRTFDVNDAGQVHTYLRYLADLPYEEQLYWKSFNEAPGAPISKRAFQADFEGSWDLEYDPLDSLKQFLREIHENRVPWWKLREDNLLERVQYPITKSADEWANEIHSLDKLLIEGFQTHALRSRATSLGRTPAPEWKSLKLIEEILLGLGKEGAEARELTEPLRELNSLRSKISGHATGKEATQIKSGILKEHGTYSAHFRRLCARCDEFVPRLARHFLRLSADEGYSDGLDLSPSMHLGAIRIPRRRA